MDQFALSLICSFSEEEGSAIFKGISPVTTFPGILMLEMRLFCLGLPLLLVKLWPCCSWIIRIEEKA